MITKPTRGMDASFKAFYDEISEDWEIKAANLRARRWNKITREMDM